MKIEKIPQDPVAFVMSFMKIMKHLDDREMRLTHQRIIMALLLGQKYSETGVPMKQIVKWTGLTKEEIEPLMEELIASRHAHAVVPTFGPVTYKLGSLGQQFCNSIRRAFEKGETQLVKEAAEWAKPA